MIALSIKPKEREANARLIASAPDLLEACKKLLKAGDERNPQQWIDAVVCGKQAIAKAEGGINP